MRRAVICLTRVPQAGTTKTRLQPFLTPQMAAELQTVFLRDIAAVLREVDADVFVFHTTDDPGILRDIFRDASFAPQVPGDLGDRMHMAIQAVLDRGYEACALIGSDLPLITVEKIEACFEALTHGDVVLGPNPDGGYWLVGMKEPNAAVFQLSLYGHSSVFKATVAAIQNSGRTAVFGPSLGDVDTPQDLLALREILRDRDNHTARYLKALFNKESGCYKDLNFNAIYPNPKSAER